MQFLIFVINLIAYTMADTYLYPIPSQQLNTPLYLIRTGQEQQSQLQQQPQQLQQYFTQDTLGQYSYGYSEPLSTKQEIRSADGTTQGTYSYIDANGLLQTVDYTADTNGFRVTATNLPKDLQEGPKPVMDTPEVAAAREQHLAAYKAIEKGDYSSSSILPQQVEDTAEVAAAKKDFFALYSAEEEKQKLLQKSALLKNQGFPTSTVFKSTITTKPAVNYLPSLKVSSSTPAVQSTFTGLKPAIFSKPAVAYLPTLKAAPIVPSTSVITYGYQLGSAIKPQRYYLPVA